MAETKLSIKLLIDNNGKRVLFAEAGKDCVDFLFFILSLPVSTLIRLLGKQQMVGALPNLYESIETLNESYIQPNITKDTLLQPAAPLPGYSVPLLSIEGAPQDKQFYKCSNLQTRLQSQHYYDDDGRRRGSSNCREGYDYVCVDPPGVVQRASSCGIGGFVKEVVTYMVMDDLVVKPMSTISSITLLAHFSIKDVCALEEKVVNLGINEAVMLLKASLVSNKVLTSVFLSGDD